MYVCPFKFILGISCPGCGMTRALFYACTFRFKEAFHYHPLFPVVILWCIGLILYYFKKIHPGRKTQDMLTWLTIIMFFAVYFVRLFSGSDVISFSPGESVILRIISHFGYNSWLRGSLH